MCVQRVNSLLLLFTVVLLSCIWLWLFNRLSSSHTVVQGVNSSECKEIQIHQRNTHAHIHQTHTCINYSSFVYVAYLSVRSKTGAKHHCAAGRAACRATTRVGRMMALSIFLPLQPRTQQQQECVRGERGAERTVMEEWGIAGSCSVALILTSLSQGNERESTTQQHNRVRACLPAWLSAYVCVWVKKSY